jgi:glutamine synthetase
MRAISCGDSTGNLCACLAAIVGATAYKRLVPGYEAPVNLAMSQRNRSAAPMPGSLQESLAALEEDQGFLATGEVFTRDVIDTWIDYKRKKEIDPVRLRPHPWEFYLYFDI